MHTHRAPCDDATKQTGRAPDLLITFANLVYYNVRRDIRIPEIVAAMETDEIDFIRFAV